MEQSGQLQMSQTNGSSGSFVPGRASSMGERVIGRVRETVTGIEREKSRRSAGLASE